MESEDFENILRLSWSTSEGSWDRHYENLVNLLSEQSKESILGFYLFLQERSKPIFRPDLYCATFLLCEGYFSADSFMNFVEAISGLPNAIYKKILENPDSITEIDEMLELKWDGFDYRLAAIEAYDRELGKPLWTNSLEKCLPEFEFDTEHYWGPIRGCITVENLKNWLPKLFEEFGEEAIASTTLTDT